MTMQGGTRRTFEHLDTRLLPVLIELHRTRSVSRAARALGLSQSGASAALARLRRHFDDEIFLPTRAGLEPTALGKSLLEPAGSVLRAIEMLHATQSFDPLTAQDEFRVVMGDIMERAVLCLVEPVLSEVAPQAGLTSLSRDRRDVEAALAAGEIDMAIGFFPELKSAHIVQTRLGDVGFGSFVRPQHPLAGTRPDLETYCAHRHVAITSDCNICQVVENFLLRSGVDRNVQIRTSHFECVPLLMKNSDLIVTVPTDPDRGGWFYGGDAVQLPVPLEMPRVINCVYWHRRVHDDPRHRWWRSLIVDTMRKVDLQAYT